MNRFVAITAPFTQRWPNISARLARRENNHAMPPRQHCTYQHEESAATRVLVQIKRVPAIGKQRVDPSAYYEYLKKAVANIKCQNPNQARLVDRSVTSNLFEHCDILRQDGVKLRVTRELLQCFFDLSLPQTMTILDINERTMRRLRDWCELDRWPRQCMINKTHPTLTCKMVRDHRLDMLRRTYADSPYVYGLLYEAHLVGRCDVSGLPLPASVQLKRPPRVKQQARVRDEYLPQHVAEPVESVPASPPPDAPHPSPQPDPEPAPPPEPADAVDLGDLSFSDEDWLTEDLLDLPCFCDEEPSPFAAMLANGEEVW